MRIAGCGLGGIGNAETGGGRRKNAEDRHSETPQSEIRDPQCSGSDLVRDHVRRPGGFAEEETGVGEGGGVVRIQFRDAVAGGVEVEPRAELEGVGGGFDAVDAEVGLEFALDALGSAWLARGIGQRAAA